MRPDAFPLLGGLIDYAGLFPPAALDLGPALDTYLRHLDGPEAWMLSRFVVPTDRLPEVADRIGETPRPAPLRFSALGLAPESGTPDGWLDAARRSLSQARAFQEALDGQALADRFEIRLPADIALDPDGLRDLLADLDAAYRDGTDVPPSAALEVPFMDHPETVEPAAAAIAEANRHAGRPAFAIKLRCGGVTPDAFPGVETLAAAVTAARAAAVPFKATAGLHHPVRQHRDEVDARMHGFVNVFGGAALARVHGLDADALAEILSDEDPAHFSIDGGVRWQALSARPAEVADARDQFALSFGSCSFAEPVDDLRALGWL